ncbi:uncharacterized protein BP01DRAFT_368069 [Aspergillus saccharolyticus JOP 1030-1]|uniref:Uncharacterized protein n=1 Tax=Aspergillus saccharolyticus JOP 1030-1 TaxID=1450539 RepID=A0A318Z5U8_9EURO|nr:hypothetical protein BP01DRAFT_368069 [Aspergillus saccharolyticus JOP 1030-1]PYH42675.1 hypothetical protein BP01DRAFT_368069 [Aspergillus saccharolyticus JOP 1030-1]
MPRTRNNAPINLTQTFNTHADRVTYYIKNEVHPAPNNDNVLVGIRPGARIVPLASGKDVLRTAIWMSRTARTPTINSGITTAAATPSATITTIHIGTATTDLASSIPSPAQPPYTMTIAHDLLGSAVIIIPPPRPPPVAESGSQGTCLIASKWKWMWIFLGDFVVRETATFCLY